MKVAVTGASGFIGRHLIGDPSHEWAPLSRGVSTTGAEYVQSDYSLESLKRAFAGADGIVHLASAKISGASGDSERILHENFRLAHAVYSACDAVGVRWVVNVSSRMVYGPSDAMPWAEAADVHPTTHYGLSKLCGEKLAGVCVGQQSPCRVVHLRLPQVLGVPGSGVDEHVITTLLRHASSGDDMVVIRDATRQYLYVKDAVAAILRALAADVSGVFNVAMPESISVGHAAREIKAALASPSRIVAENPGDEAPVDVMMDVSKARSELGFESGWSFHDSVLDIAQSMR